MIDMRLIDADALLGRVWSEKIQAQAHGREFSTCFMSPGGTASTEWWYVEDLIENAPTIEPERKKGEWNFIGNQMFECSECGTCYTQSQFYQMRVRISDAEFPKFCPNCGADMLKEGEQDAERTS